MCGATSDVGICQSHHILCDSAWVVGERAGVLTQALNGFKFQRQRSGALVLGELLSLRIPHISHKVVLVPIPTISSHIRERGYDQVLLLSQQLGRLRHWPVQRLLVRNKNTTQHTVNRQQRKAQAWRAFVVDGGIDPDVTYVIVDDIITTGSTVIAAINLLAMHGAQHVAVAAVAYQPLD